MASQSAVCIETNVEVQFGCWGLSHIGRLCAALTVVFKDNPLSPAATQTIPHFSTFFYLRSNLLRPLAPFASDLANSKLQTLIHPCGSSDEGNSFAAAAPSQSAVVLLPCMLAQIQLKTPYLGSTTSHPSRRRSSSLCPGHIQSSPAATLCGEGCNPTGLRHH